MEELFAKLQKTSEQPQSSSSTTPKYHEPSISSPIVSPAPSGPQPHHTSAVLSPNTSAMNTPTPENGGTTRATDLLSLLKFRQNTGSAATPPTGLSSERRTSQSLLPTPSDTTSGAQSRPVSAADLVAGFVRKPSSLSSMHSPSALAPAASRPDLRGEASGSSSNPQDFLLKLLNQAPKSNLSETASFSSSLKQQDKPIESIEEAAPETMVDGLAQDLEDASFEKVSSTPAVSRGREQSPMHVFGGESAAPASTFDASQLAPKVNVFTYKNPFEQLSASSPRNRTPKPDSRTVTPQVEDLKHERDVSSSSMPAAKARKVSPKPDPRASATPPIPRETVSEALSGVGEVVDKQVGAALAQMTSKTNGNSESMMLDAKKAVQEAAVDLQEDLKDPETRREIEAGMPKIMAKAFEETIDAVADAGVSDVDWEEEAERGGQVYSLPMQPFKAVTITQLEENPPLVPLSLMMDIAKIKKPFDQIDRNLVAATNNVILYPLKNGGLRVIKQDNGMHKELFKRVPERMFNVAVSTSPKKSSDKVVEVVLATGVDGTVFWAPLTNFAAADEAYGDSEEDRGFLFPPVVSSEENTSGGQLKTRVKPSSRHPDYFAYGRGKSIYLVWPNIARTASYCDPETRVCKSSKYLKAHMLKISTGKAGKDFVFSADDTLIISLDKAGRLKFWDIRPLTHPAEHEQIHASTPLEVKVPLMTLATCPPTEKSWPTSILLVDKDKPMARGLALRYVIIGLKQNHTLQLWDLSIGKPVQEINFPHEQESDGICSVVYHAKTGVIVVAHPTRNSIYFLQTSIPPYNLSPTGQARFVNMIALKDPDLPSPQSTIIVTGIREYTFSKTSTIRSMDLLADPGPQYGEDAPAFVLYVMHSNGISEIKVDLSLIGVSSQGKLLDPVDAYKAGAIKATTIKELPPPVAGDSGSVTSESVAGAAPSSKAGRETIKKVESTTTRAARNSNTTHDISKSELESNNDKPEKKKKKDKKAQESTSQATSTAPSPFIPTEDSSKILEAESAKTRSASRKAMSDTKTAGSEAASVPTTTQETSNASTTYSSTESSGIEALIRSEFESLSQTLTQDRLQQDATAASRQEAVLKVVSRTLSENVEDSLSRVVTEGLSKITISPLKEVVASTVDRNLSTALNQAVKTSVPRELEKSLPAVLGQTLKDKQLLRSVADIVSQNVAQQVDAHFAAAMRETITPAITKLAASAAKQMITDVERRFIEQLRLVEHQQQKDNIKIDHLLKSVDKLQHTIQSMSESQLKFNSDILNFFKQMQTMQTGPPQALAPIEPAKPILSPADREREEIQAYFRQNDAENATLRWMHSERKIELFDEVFSVVDPRFVYTLSPLVVISVAATVSESFGSQIRERLALLDASLNSIDTQSPSADVQEVLPKILDVILQRIQQAYMEISGGNHQDPILKSMHSIAKRIYELKQMI